MHRVFAYGRASTQKQHLTEKGQRLQCQAYIANNLADCEYAGWYYDSDTSGGTELFERRKGRELLILPQRGDHIVFVRLDRLFRSGPDGAKSMDMLIKKGVRFWYASMPGLDTSTPMGIAFCYAQLGMAVSEKMLIADRTSQALQVLRQEGRVYGRHIPDGWRKKDGRFVPDMEERQIIARFSALRDEGYSYVEIASMHQRAVRRRGTKWDRNTIRRAIESMGLGFPKVQDRTPDLAQSP